jgi:hypothetical protein
MQQPPYTSFPPDPGCVAVGLPEADSRTPLREARMQIVQARIGGRTVVLAARADLGGLKRRIVEAVKQGAGFVDIETAGRRMLSVLVTPAIPVRFEIVEVDDAELDAESPWEQRTSSFEEHEFGDLDSFSAVEG